MWSVLGTSVVQNGSLGENPNFSQCVNIPNDFWLRFGVPAVSGDAGDWVGYCDRYRQWHAVRSSYPPRAGDVAVLARGPLTPEGHVVLVLDGSRAPYIGAEENYPTGSPVSLCSRYRSDAAGFLRLVRRG